MRFGVITFPGSNCDYDAYAAVRYDLGEDVEFLWHAESDLHGSDMIILPGGFSYGDYLRSGAIARFSPIMKEVVEFAHGGGPVLGICNGFQILLEAGLLPGAMLRNRSLRFACKYVNLRVETINTLLTAEMKRGSVLRIPIAHSEGNYFADNDTLKMLIDNDQILFRYCREDSEITNEANPNGAVYNIAGICNERRNVFGMMPHPERATQKILGSVDGLQFFESLKKHYPERVSA